MPDHPHIAILGAGPTGLEAALAAAEAGVPFTLYEAAPEVSGHIRAWGHVRLFSPWEINASPRARRALARAGHAVPEGDACPTGEELAAELLRPLAELPAVAENLRPGTRVLEVGRRGLLKHEEIASAARAARPFRLLLSDDAGREWIEEAGVVLDCTGTYGHPNRAGDGGIAAPGEAALGAAIRRAIPDFRREAGEWAGKTTLLVGAGHSAQTAARDLAALAAEHPGTRVVWALRRPEPVWEPIADDPLPERARLATDATALAGGANPAVEARPGVAVEAFDEAGGKIRVTLRRRDGGGRETVAVDRVLSLTGFVGDHHLYRQLQVHECYATSGPMKLAAALLGAGGGDCLAQESHGVEVLKNPEPGFFLLGSKSYGRNTTFLMRAGWGQVEEVFELLSA